MTLKNLYRNKFTQNMLKQNVWILWMSVLLNSLCTLLPMILTVAEKLQTGKIYGAEYILMNNTFLYMVSIVGGTVVAIGMFRYLNSKPEVDFYHSIPVKKRSLFFSRYMTGITAYLTGLKLTYFTTAIMGLVIGAYKAGDIWDLFLTLVSVILTFLATYAFVVMGVVVTGNIFMAVCTAFGIMFSPVAFTSIVIYLCEMNYEFMGYGVTDIIMDVWKWTTPLFVAFNPLLGYEDVGLLDGIIPMGMLWIVLTIIAYLSFMKRPSENAGQPVAVNVFRPIIKILGVLGASSLGGILFGYSSAFMFYVGALLIGFIFHMVFEVLFAGDVRASFKNLIHFPFIYGMVALLFAVTYLDMTGFDERLAPVEDIECIVYNDKIAIRDEENIAIIHSWMKEAIDRHVEQKELARGEVFYAQEEEVMYLEMESSGFAEATVTTNVEVVELSGDYIEHRNIYQELTIHLKDGSSYERAYYLYNVPIDDIKSIETSQEYINQRFNYNLSYADLEAIREVTLDTRWKNKGKWSVPYINLNYDGREITGEEFVTIYHMLNESKELLTSEYISENTPILSIQIYNFNDRRDFTLYVFDVNDDVLEYLGVQSAQVKSDVGFEVGLKYHDELLELMNESDIKKQDEYNQEIAYYELEHNDELFAQIQEEMTPILGYVSLYGNYNQYDKPLVIITVKGSTVGYITLEALEKLVK